MTDPIVSGTACSFAMATAILTFLLLGLVALVVAGWKRFRAGSRLLQLCCNDYALADAELDSLEARTLEDERRLREAMEEAYNMGETK